jgi:hypothetical protein
MAANRAPRKPDLEFTIIQPGTPQHLDGRLRHAAHQLDRWWEDLRQLIAEAKTREIHKDLGFKSWPDYIADVAREMPNVARSVEERRQVVGLLAGEGMSQRAIADAVGVSQKTVDRDLDQVSHDDSPCTPTDFGDSAPVTTPDTVTGRDGKQYPAKPKREPKPKPKPDAPKPDVPKPSAKEERETLWQEKIRKKLEREFFTRVQAEARMQVAMEIRRAERIQDNARRALHNAQKGYVFTPDDFNLIRSCLHPDSRASASDEKLAEAFRLFNEAKIVLIPPPSPTDPDLPSSFEESLRQGVARRMKGES